MPIGFPLAGGGAGIATALRYTYSATGAIAQSVADAIFFSALNVYCLMFNNSAGVFYSGNPEGPYEYSNTGISGAGSTVRGVEYDGRLYRVRLGNAIATAVRSTDDLVNWQTDFGGIIINDADANADKMVLATNYAAGGPNNGVIFTGTTWDNIYSGNAVNALSCIVTPTGRIVFGFASGIIRYSDDDGNNWTEVNLGSASNVNRLYSNGDNLLFAGLANGIIFESNDDGSTWSNGAPTSESLVPVSVIAFGGLGNDVQVYCNSGVIAKRIAPFTWRAQPSPTAQNFIGALRKDAVLMGFITSYSVAAL